MAQVSIRDVARLRPEQVGKLLIHTADWKWRREAGGSGACTGVMHGGCKVVNFV